MAHEHRQGERGHRQLEHTADLAVELWAPSQQELLAEGARAVVDLLTDGAQVAGRARRRISIDAVDDEDRLVQWLNEILYAAVVDGFLFGDVVRLTLDEGALEAEITGEADAADRLTDELKSATYHDLLLERDDETWRARVVIDV